MLLQNTTDIENFKKYFDLFQETIEVSPILSQNAKDALSEKFKEVGNILNCELQQIAINEIKVVEPVDVKENLVSAITSFPFIIIHGEPFFSEIKLQEVLEFNKDAFVLTYKDFCKTKFRNFLKRKTLVIDNVDSLDILYPISEIIENGICTTVSLVSKLYNIDIPPHFFENIILRFNCELKIEKTPYSIKKRLEKFYIHNCKNTLIPTANNIEVVEPIEVKA